MYIVELTGMVEPVHPILRVWLSAMDRADVVGFTEVVPSDDLDHIEHVAVVNDTLPSCRVQMRVSIVDKLLRIIGNDF